jgi:hypothetical protein
MHCQVTQVFQIQLLVIQFVIKMFHIGFMQVLILRGGADKSLARQSKETGLQRPNSGFIQHTPHEA